MRRARLGVGFGFAGGTAWTPASFGADLAAWYKADTGVFSDAGSTPATDGQTVQQWNDQSGNGADLSQATSGSRPTLRTTGFNSLPGIEFRTGSPNDFIQTTASAVALGSAEIGVFVVYNHANISDGGGARLVVFTATGESAPWDNVASFIFHHRGDNHEIIKVERFNSDRVGGVSVPHSTNMRATFVASAAGHALYTDNVLQAGPSDALGSFGATGELGIGGSAAGGQGLNATIAEIVVVKRLPTSGERTSIHAYFADIWGL